MSVCPRRVATCLPLRLRAQPEARCPTAPSRARSRPSRGSTGSATPTGRVIYVGKAKNLRAAAVVLLPGRRQPAPAHRHHGHDRGQRRVDDRQDRGRGAAAGVLLDQGVRPALQREVPRRQVLPLARGDRGRRVPAGDGRPRRQAQGHPLLRALRPRLGDPRDRRPAAAGLPDALVQQRRLQALEPDRPAVPARLHRQVRGPVRRQRQRRGAPRDRRRLLRLHGRPDDRVRQARREGDVRRLRRARLREGGPAARRPRRAPQGAREAGGRARRRHRCRRDRAGRGPARGRRPDLLRARRPDPRPARLGGRPGRRGRHRRAGRRLPAPAVRRRHPRRDPARDPGARAAARRGDVRDAARRPARLEGGDPGAAARRQADPPGDGRAERRRSRWRCTRPGAPAT